MKLDRNVNSDGKGKYALIKLRLFEKMPTDIEELVSLIRENPDCIDFGFKGSDSEFFVIRLKDICAVPTLRAYYAEALKFDKEWAEQVSTLVYLANKIQNKQIPS